VRHVLLTARPAGAVLPGQPFQPLEAFRVVDLQGGAEEWEAQLNEAAAEGYELVQLVGPRAVFRLG
jgi:hypothetical protein